MERNDYAIREAARLIDKNPLLRFNYILGSLRELGTMSSLSSFRALAEDCAAVEPCLDFFVTVMGQSFTKTTNEGRFIDENASWGKLELSLWMNRPYLRFEKRKDDGKEFPVPYYTGTALARLKNKDYFEVNAYASEFRDHTFMQPPGGLAKPLLHKKKIDLGRGNYSLIKTQSYLILLNKNPDLARISGRG
jgi:hypothetical protein